MVYERKVNGNRFYSITFSLATVTAGCYMLIAICAITVEGLKESSLKISREAKDNAIESIWARSPVLLGDDSRKVWMSHVDRGNIESTSKLLEERVYGGKETALHEFPYMIRFVYAGFFTFCGGAILNSEWVVTAAHCFDDVKHRAAVVIAGDHKKSYLEGNEQYVQIRRIIRHPRYTSIPLEHDIALVQVNPAFDLNDEAVGSANLPKNGSVSSASEATVVGWGKTEDTVDSDTLRKVILPIVPFNICQEQYKSVVYPGGTPVIISEDMLCAGADGLDSCQGDSGGPLTCSDPQSQYSFLCGIVSFGVQCGHKDYAGVNTKVSAYVDWIKSHTAMSSSSRLLVPVISTLLISSISLFS